MAKNMNMNIDAMLSQSASKNSFEAQDKKEVGRPKVDESERLTKKVALYCTQDEFDFIERQSKKLFTNKSSYLRILLAQKMQEK